MLSFQQKRIQRTLGHVGRAYGCPTLCGCKIKTVWNKYRLNDSASFLKSWCSVFQGAKNFENRFDRIFFRLDQKSIKNIFWDRFFWGKFRKFSMKIVFFRFSDFSKIFRIFGFPKIFNENLDFSKFSKFRLFRSQKNNFDRFLIKSKKNSVESIFKIFGSSKNWASALQKASGAIKRLLNRAFHTRDYSGSGHFCHFCKTCRFGPRFSIACRESGAI